MDIQNIFGAEHSNYMAALNTSKTLTGTAHNTSFADVLATNSVNSQVVTMALDGKALLSGAFQMPGGGYVGINVYKSENYSEDNPVMLVKGTNADGKPYEVEVNINDLNPRNASLIELFALQCYYVANGKELWPGLDALSALRQQEFGNIPGLADSFMNGIADIFTKLDFIPVIKETMEIQHFHGNREGYTHYKNVIDVLLSIVDNTSISPEARAARQASVDSRQNMQDDLADRAEDKQGSVTDFADYKLLFPTLHSDVAEFKKENPYVSERELWNYIDEKYNLRRSATVITLEEAQANLQPHLSTEPSFIRVDGLPSGWSPNVKIAAIDLEEWKRAFLKV
ncbi:MAG: hypothetical protein LBQ86_08865 [Holophagales bacterium]|jgi:hypothetical protein|nr:hypothetical protein [Holophagales bacterium]